VQLSCLDADGDGRLTGDDDARFDGVDLALDPAKVCLNEATHADFYADDRAVDCGDGGRALLLVLVGGGGTDLLQASEGESIGLLKVADALGPRLNDAHVAVRLVLASPAVFGGVPAQGTMERYLAAEVARRLDAASCLEAVIVGHSHGGVTVTAVAAALEDRYPGRLYGILLDRSAVLYDGDPDAMPRTTPILNIYQLNEGWHGVAIEQADVTNADESAEYAPFAPSDGGSGLGRVSHKTLDDATAVQQRVEDAIAGWVVR
jgi:pimeloyl-ACP methyl ester carboxylesterase